MRESVFNEADAPGGIEVYLYSLINKVLMKGKRENFIG